MHTWHPAVVQLPGPETGQYRDCHQTGSPGHGGLMRNQMEWFQLNDTEAARVSIGKRLMQCRSGAYSHFP